ncbi:uncharacterized protein LOC113316165 [Papaver somniferum]|uniref:uncharacterized protein LOC113316165 n=1 Tax=Papaver somniferum TaxID=3469 RepID=UPI000E701CCB|nr:uncharacterized protein LOC113316165 [Papaver somniferum]
MDCSSDGFIKINVDATFHLGKSAAAVVARDHKGDIVAVASTIQRQSKTLAAEASAFLLALNVAQQMQFHNCIIEGDSQTVVKVLNGELHTTPWRILILSEELKSISHSFNSVSFKFVKRRANAVAHNLAKYAAKHNVQAIWIPSQIPRYIVSCLSEAPTAS